MMSNVVMFQSEVTVDFVGSFKNDPKVFISPY